MLGMCFFGDSHRSERVRFPPADRAVLDEDARGAPGGCSEHLPAVCTPQACSPSSGEPGAAWGAAGAFSRQERAYGLVCASAVNVPAWVLQAAWVCTCPASSSKLGELSWASVLLRLLQHVEGSEGGMSRVWRCFKESWAWPFISLFTSTQLCASHFE